jgi:hypothetical protein
VCSNAIVYRVDAAQKQRVSSSWKPPAAAKPLKVRAQVVAYA